MKTTWILFPLVFISAAAAVPAPRAVGPIDLERAFLQPPASAKPWVYWYWINGNATREGITGVLQAGPNRLEVTVVNLSANRQIGDEFLPEDSERNADGSLKQWPQWLKEGRASPTGRYTFATTRILKKNDPLEPSGLIGPVTVETTAEVTLK